MHLPEVNTHVQLLQLLPLLSSSDTSKTVFIHSARMAIMKISWKQHSTNRKRQGWIFHILSFNTFSWIFWNWVDKVHYALAWVLCSDFKCDLHVLCKLTNQPYQRLPHYTRDGPHSAWLVTCSCNLEFSTILQEEHNYVHVIFTPGKHSVTKPKQKYQSHQTLTTLEKEDFKPSTKSLFKSVSFRQEDKNTKCFVTQCIKALLLWKVAVYFLHRKKALATLPKWTLRCKLRKGHAK